MDGSAKICLKPGKARVRVWLVVSAAVATFTWVCDNEPLTSWWRHFKDAFLLAFDL